MCPFLVTIPSFLTSNYEPDLFLLQFYYLNVLQSSLVHLKKFHVLFKFIYLFLCSNLYIQCGALTYDLNIKIQPGAP